MDSPVQRSRQFDWFSLLAGFAALGASAYILGDGPVWWPAMDLRWIIAGAAVLIGVVLLGSSIVGGRRDRHRAGHEPE